MPRQARLDAPGLLQHVMARGIERREIFKDDSDRRSFLDRLAVILDETQTQCYAWSLIPNHFHLLLKTTLTPLPTVMRRLMTGHAITFNKRHRRAGHLFQNRYKSVVCEEDNYLLELTRYIHLNPLRAKLVKNLRELDKYPWSGHSAVLGRSENPVIPDPPAEKDEEENPEQAEESLAEKTIEDLLLHFGKTREEARKKYRQFVKDGIERGRRPEFQGGGLIRSSGGNRAGLAGKNEEERELSDDRILGSGEFVAEALKKTKESFEEKSAIRPPLEELMDRVSRAFDMTTQQMSSRSRKRLNVQARSVFAHVAVRNYGFKGIEVAKVLSSSPPTVSRIVENGQNVLDNNKDLAVKLAIVEI